MKFYKNKERVLSVEITPLIDIVFLLVIFFVVTSKIETNQYLTLDLPQSESFASALSNNSQNIILLETGVLIIDNQEFSMTELDKLMAGVAATFSKSEVVVLSIESKAFHEWVISLMDGLQQLGFQNIQIKTYTD
ncbi:biopolymer transporter ExbD [Gammaproteobacteria bacterium]|jgi:biopolymer transport protein ExbD|nr:biopolymer transporter ExbD [Gammaproteobacteria bacterium]MDB3868163.1 biopolymer transporter ExbD [Gammaproteobacteria bacterium]MDC0440546.1 biopolymer transporter ExbD [Gammaproteobacteria bacterium]MDC0884370.1 biopolymer transporter ExbD [Gammaproteobacteria bacterium]|tara:strand:+ start:421 stop:825 length:405 start_codon:yes stop_codon:yes gene_type:complete